MNQLINLFRAVPDVIWSAVLASLLTLSGVLISNRSNTTRQRIQLQHDADQKAKERNAALRREVYLKLAEELTQANSYLARLPQVDASKANPAEGMQGFFAAAARLQLVAEPKTALLVNELVGSYGELLLRLISRSMPLQSARQKITLHDDLYSRAEEQVTRVLGKMVKFNESAQASEQVFCALQRSFEGFQTQASEHADRRGRRLGSVQSAEHPVPHSGNRRTSWHRWAADSRHGGDSPRSWPHDRSRRISRAA
jgi:hypothetical protein